MGAFTPLFTPAPRPPSRDAERSPLDGTWRIRAFDSLGVRTAVEVETTWEVQGGRLVIRPSGTEPLIRVMAEGDDAAQVEAVVERICAAVRAVATA